MPLFMFLSKNVNDLKNWMIEQNREYEAGIMIFEYSEMLIMIYTCVVLYI